MKRLDRPGVPGLTADDDHGKADSVFSGISTFGRLPYAPCLSAENVKYDIAFIGASLDPASWPKRGN